MACWTPDEIAFETDHYSQPPTQEVKGHNRLLLAVIAAICVLGAALINFAGWLRH